MITIIIPMRNEERFVGACLDSVLSQLGDLPECEVLCVDGDSTDRTRKIVMTCADRDPRVRILDNPQRIVPTAMNIAIREARGDVVIRLDCHAEYAPGYFRNCLEVLERTNADNVGGYVETVPTSDTPVGMAISAALSSRFGVGGSVFRIGGGEEEVDTVPFGCFRRDVFDRFGLYDERLVRNQDIELNTRIRRGGGRIVISPTIRSTYYARSTFGGLRQQAFGNGLWNPYTIYLAGEGVGARHFVPLVFVLSLLVLPVVGLFLRPLWWLLACECVTYFLVGTVFARRAAQQTSASAFLVLLTFVQLHLAYGVGSLLGVLTSPMRFGLGPLTRTRVGQVPARETGTSRKKHAQGENSPMTTSEEPLRPPSGPVDQRED